MNRRIFALILTIALIALTAVGCTNDNGEVETTTNDEISTNNEETNEPEEIPEYITIKDMRFETLTTTELDLGTQQLNNSDIEPLKYIVNLTNLTLNGNQISDISALAGLTSLTWLVLANNQINDISELEKLTNLTGLGLDSNQISDISALAGLTNLKTLALSYNDQISDISVLFGLANLEKLYLQGLPISDEQFAELKEALPNTEITR